MLEVNLSDLDETTGVREAYWVLAVEMARKRFAIASRNRVTAAGATNNTGEG